MWPPGLLRLLLLPGLALLGRAELFSRGQAADQRYAQLLRCRLPYDTPDRFLGGCGRGGRIAGLLRAGPIFVFAFFLRHAVSFPHHTQQPCRAEPEWTTAQGISGGRARISGGRARISGGRAEMWSG